MMAAASVAISPPSLEALQLQQQQQLLPLPAPISTTQNQKTAIECPYRSCDRVFTKASYLDYHVRSHHTHNRSYVCPHNPCEKTFLRQDHLKHHINSVHTNKREYECKWPGCSKRFVSTSRLGRHQKSHEDRGPKKHACQDFPPCTAVFKTADNLQRHVRKVHLNQDPFQCDHVDKTTGVRCSYGCSRRSKLEDHEIRVHSTHPPRRYHCMICDTFDENAPNTENLTFEVTFASYEELLHHNKQFHPPRCDECSILFTTGHQLENHLDIQHGQTSLQNRKIHPCQVEGCKKSFTKQSNLLTHIKMVHEKLKPFICTEDDLNEIKAAGKWNGKDACGKSFTTKQSLATHVKTLHVWKQWCPFRCGLTDLSLSKQDGVGEWDGSNACGLYFTSKSSLERHVRRNHVNRRPTDKDVSVVTKLTGFLLAEESGRHIPCVLPECPERFKRNYDLKVHAIAFHDMSESSIAEHIAERNALSGGKFWIGGIDDEFEIGDEFYTGLPIEENEVGDFEDHEMEQHFQNNLQIMAEDAMAMDVEDPSNDPSV